MPCQFVLQIVGITDATIEKRPSSSYPTISDLADVTIHEKSSNNEGKPQEECSVLAHAPSMGCDGLADSNTSVLVAPCPPDQEEDVCVLSKLGSNKPFTHSIFLSVFKERELDENGNLTKIITNKKKSIYKKNEKEDDDDDDEYETEDNEQYIAINPKLAIELTESIIEKKLFSSLPPVKTFKRNVPMFLEEKVDSVFSFLGFCEDNIPFIIEVNNVPYAEYKHGERRLEIGPGTPPKGNIKNRHFTKTAYFPEKDCTNTEELIKRIHDLTTIKKESVTRCYIAYIIERTDISHFEVSKYNPEYQEAVKKAVAEGVIIVPIVISWTNEGVALFVTDSLPFLTPL